MKQHVVRIMLRRIADFFRVMCDNKEQRLFYVFPVDQQLPYAYQHSSIRDMATICQLLDLMFLCKEKEMDIEKETIILFEKACRNTVAYYHRLWEIGDFLKLPEGNVGDLGFLLLALLKCQAVSPSKLPVNWESTINLVVNHLIKVQNSDGSMEIFFNAALKSEQKSAEAFYLPEALIGLISILESEKKDKNILIKNAVKKSIAYCCQESNSNHHLSTDSSTFYFNWQSQLLFHWIHTKSEEEIDQLILEKNHLEKMIETIKEKRIARMQFGSQDATVEIACYFEGLVHAKKTLEMFDLYTLAYKNWFTKEIERCLVFLYDIQSLGLNSFNGGFIHSRFSQEARVDVAGHVCGGLKMLVD